MAYKYLDKTGLSYFWSKLKALLSLKADDAGVVHKAGTETVTGVKIFSNYTDISNERINALRFKDTRIHTGTPLNDNIYQGMYWYNADDRASASIYKRYNSSSDSYSLVFNAHAPDNSDNNTQLSLTYPSSSGLTTANFYIGPEVKLNNVKVRRTADNSRMTLCGGSDSDFGATLSLYGKDHSSYPGWASIHAKDGTNDRRLVCKSSGYLLWTGYQYQLLCDYLEKNVVPQTVQYAGYTIRDVNNVCLGCFQYAQRANGAVDVKIAVFPDDTVDDDFGAIYIGFDSNGVAYGRAPSTSENRSDGRDIVTRNWIPKDTRIVHTTGNETISGTKTFSSQVNTQQGIAIEQTSTIDGVSTTHKVSLDVNATSLNAGLWDYTNSKWAWLIDKDGNAYFYGNARTATKATQDENGRNISSGYLWRGSYERIQGTSSAHNDLNNYKNAGFYNVKTQYVDNCPSDIGVDAVLLVYPWNTDNYLTQEITESAASGDVRRWLRKLNSSTWSSWKQIAFTSSSITGTASNVTGVVAIANGGTGLTSLDTFVRTTGNQTIGGSKTFTALPIIDRTSSTLAAGALSHVLVCKYKNSADNVDFTTYPISVIGNDNTNATNIGVRLGSINGTTVVSAGECGVTFCSARSKYNDENLYLIADNEIHIYPKCSNDSTSFAGPVVISGTASAGGTGSTTTITATTFNGALGTASDERLKTPAQAIPDEVLDAWEAVGWEQFQFLDAVSAKGDAARLHLGLIAQKVKRVFEDRGLDPVRYSILCLDESGMWMIHYVEALVLEAACQRRENARLKERVASLEERLAALELRVA